MAVKERKSEKHEVMMLWDKYSIEGRGIQSYCTVLKQNAIVLSCFFFIVE